MVELIDRNELLKAMNTFEPIVDGAHDTFGMLEHAQWEYGCAMVRNAPAVEAVVVRHGRWLVQEDRDIADFRNVRCSACGKDYACHYGMLQLQNFRYCPECGARMEG